jgi:hypothetical protein
MWTLIIFYVSSCNELPISFLFHIESLCTRRGNTWNFKALKLWAMTTTTTKPAAKIMDYDDNNNKNSSKTNNSNSKNRKIK